MRLLAHIASQQELKLEPTATQSLTHILQSSPELAESLTEFFWPDVGFELGHVECERNSGDASRDRPDITIFDRAGRRRIFVENKFWAGLTPAQPVKYLAALPGDMPSGLVFIVPEQRVPAVWDELKRRIRGVYEFGNESTSNNIRRLQLGARVLCVTSWRHVLGFLEQRAPSDDLRCDVLQLSSLAESGELDGFAPLRSQELSDSSVPKRMIDYCDLIKDIVSELEHTRRIARTGRLKVTNDWHDTGRYLKLLEQFEVWLGVARKPWKNTGITPMWLRVTPSELCNLNESYHRLAEYFEHVQVDGGVKYLPIRLQTAVEREQVIRYAADQVQGIAEKFEEITGISGRDVEAN